MQKTAIYLLQKRPPNSIISEMGGLIAAKAIEHLRKKTIGELPHQL
jgi:hypothetical protein